MDADLEERIEALEDELRILKNEVQQTLLEIKEYLGEGYFPFPQPPKKEAEQPVSDIKEQLAQGDFSFLQSPGKVEPAAGRRQPFTLEEAIGSREELIDPSTIASLGGWLMEKVRKVGTERLVTMLELYALTGRFPTRLKETLIQFIRSSAHHEGSELSPKDYDAMLLELNGLMMGKTKEGDSDR